MLTVHLEVNNRRIGTFGAWNTNEVRVSPENNEVVEFKYRIFDMMVDGNRGSITDYPEIGEVWHDRDDGAVKLTEKMMAKANEEGFCCR